MREANPEPSTPTKFLPWNDEYEGDHKEFAMQLININLVF